MKGVDFAIIDFIIFNIAQSQAVIYALKCNPGEKRITCNMTIIYIVENIKRRRMQMRNSVITYIILNKYALFYYDQWV